MNIFIVYCHPSKTSFTYQVKDEFIKGLEAAGHTYLLSDLYDMDFNGEMTEEEYLREAYYKADQKVAEDVLMEQDKIQHSDAIVFIYPVFWTEAPAKLVGWFDRVWSSGFAYTPSPTMKVLEKALCIAIAGKSAQSFIETKEGDAMETVMLGDRIRDRAKEKQMVILDGMSHWDETTREMNLKHHLKTAYELGYHFDIAGNNN